MCVFFFKKDKTLLNICDLYQTQYFLLLINELVHRYHSHPTEQDLRQTNPLHDSSDEKKKLFGCAPFNHVFLYYFKNFETVSHTSIQKDIHFFAKVSISFDS